MAYQLTVNSKPKASGTLQEIQAAVMELVTDRLADAPERVAVDAQTVRRSFSTGKVASLVEAQGQWFWIFDAHGEEPLRLKVTIKGA